MTTNLHVDVYLSAAKPIPSKVPAFDATGQQATWPASTSTLILGRTEAMLVDTLMTATEARDLSKWIDGHDTQLRDIYITHPHADHLFGLGSIMADFPGARGIALAPLVDAIAEQTSPGYLEVWEGFFPGQIPQHLRVPGALDGDSIELEGHLIRFVNVGRTDTEPSSIVHVPALDTIISGDVAYNGIHPWLAGSTAASRQEWLNALDTLESLAPRTIVVGHKDPSASDDDSARILDETRRYLHDFDDAVAASDSPQELIDRMLVSHGSLGNVYTLWLAAWDQLGQAA